MQLPAWTNFPSLRLNNRRVKRLKCIQRFHVEDLPGYKGALDGRGGGGSPCRMSIIRKGRVALSILRKGCVACR